MTAHSHHQHAGDGKETKKMAIHLEKKTTIQIHNDNALHIFPSYARVGYSTGSLGWNCDIFDLPGLQVRRGYRAGGKMIPSELYEDLDAAAKDVPYEECYGLRLEFRDRVFRYLNNLNELPPDTHMQPPPPPLRLNRQVQLTSHQLGDKTMRAHHASDNLSHAAVKHFTADELYEIALDEYKKAGRHVGQGEKMGIVQWAYWSAERDDFHSEEEARAELRAFPEEETGDLKD